MKHAQNIVAQGELLLVRVDSLPESATPVPPVNGQLIVGHSETGHHHSINTESFPGVELFEIPGDVLDGYIKVGRPFADLVHLRDFDQHETLRLPEGTWHIRRQREYAPDGWQAVCD